MCVCAGVCVRVVVFWVTLAGPKGAPDFSQRGVASLWVVSITAVECTWWSLLTQKDSFSFPEETTTRVGRAAETNEWGTARDHRDGIQGLRARGFGAQKKGNDERATINSTLFIVITLLFFWAFLVGPSSVPDLLAVHTILTSLYPCMLH